MLMGRKNCSIHGFRRTRTSGYLGWRVSKDFKALEDTLETMWLFWRKEVDLWTKYANQRYYDQTLNPSFPATL